MMYAPAPLRKGDKIAITCPSGYLDLEKISNAVQYFESQGLEVIVGETLKCASDNYFSAPDAVKIKELQSYIDDPSVRTIFMGRGGYGMSRIIDHLDFSGFLSDPKWICGFSDITLLHSHVNALGVASLHAPMCSTFNLEYDEIRTKNIAYLSKALWHSEPMVYEYNMDNTFYNEGRCQGRLLGGNLAMLAHSIGSSSVPNYDGAILFIEDIGEHIYKIDRMLYQLKRAGIFDNLKGVIVGQFSDVEDTTRPFGLAWDEVIYDHFKELGIPIAFDFPSGHEDENLSVKLGINHELYISYPSVKLIECPSNS